MYEYVLREALATGTGQFAQQQKLSNLIAVGINNFVYFFRSS